MIENRKIVTISKAELSKLPAATYNGPITLVDTIEKAEEAAKILAAQTIVGFDTETKPNFKRGHSNKVALLQLSTPTDCFLFRLNRIGLPQKIKDILESETILKVGLSIHDDFNNLNKIYSLKPANFIDLQGFVKDYLIADNSLTRIYGILFDKRISKGQRLSNWEADELSPHQQAYAALDAVACVKIYEYLAGNNFNPYSSKHLYEIPSEEI